MNCSLDHLHFRCSNLQDSVKWFKETLGAEERFKAEVRGNPLVGMALAGTTFLLSAAPLQTPNVTGSSSSSSNYGLWHFGLKVPNLEEAITYLKSKNVKITMEPTLLPGGVKISFIEGPDDISIEIIERAS